MHVRTGGNLVQRAGDQMYQRIRRFQVSGFRPSTVCNPLIHTYPPYRYCCPLSELPKPYRSSYKVNPKLKRREVDVENAVGIAARKVTDESWEVRFGFYPHLRARLQGSEKVSEGCYPPRNCPTSLGISRCPNTCEAFLSEPSRIYIPCSIQLSPVFETDSISFAAIPKIP